jgi:hypothetical protein
MFCRSSLTGPKGHAVEIHQDWEDFAIMEKYRSEEGGRACGEQDGF